MGSCGKHREELLCGFLNVAAETNCHTLVLTLTTCPSKKSKILYTEIGLFLSVI